VPRVTKRTRLLEIAGRHAWPRIRDAEWTQLRAAIPNLTPEDLQSLEIPVDPPWSGIRQHTLGELEASLIAMSDVYVRREDLRRFARATVIRAKERAKGAAKNPAVSEEKRRLKTEMAEWLLVWLGDPALFPAWVRIRRELLEGTRAPAATAAPGPHSQH